MVSGWFRLVSGRLWLVSGGFGWFQVVSGGFRWSTVLVHTADCIYIERSQIGHHDIEIVTDKTNLLITLT